MKDMNTLMKTFLTKKMVRSLFMVFLGLLVNNPYWGIAQDKDIFFKGEISETPELNLNVGDVELAFISKDRDYLFDQAQYVTNPGVINGADASNLQGAQTIFGPGAQHSNGNMVGDDFTLDVASTITSIEVYAYQTGSTTTSTFNSLYATIYDGNPMEGGQIIWGDMNTDIMTSTAWTNCYRTQNLSGTTRPIMSITAENLNVALEAGTYYLVWNLGGTGSSGPWGQPVVILGQTNTGNGIQYTNSSSWQYLTDDGCGDPYGMAFRLGGHIGTTYDFEDHTMQGWTTIDADGDGHTWNLGSTIMSAPIGHNSSSDMVLSQSFINNVGALTPDNYLVSPAKAEYPAISFFACAQDNAWAAEHFGVAVSTTTATASAFTTIQEWTMTAKGQGVPAPGRNGDREQGNWYEYTVDLSAYTGQSIWVAIRHFDCSDNFYLDVDDITLGGTIPVPPVVDLYDFEDDTMQGWTTIDADGDGHTWMLGSTLMGAGYGHNGSSNLVLSQSYVNNVGALTPDNYLVSPTKAEYPAISFYACAQDNAWAAEHFGVAVSTTTATASAFTMVQEWTMTAKGQGVPAPGRDDGMRTQGNWYHYSVDLSAYAGQEIWVAIRHFDCTDNFYLDVDDISFPTSVVTYQITTSVMPSNGGVATGAGVFNAGSTCSLTATPNQGFVFDNWTKAGTTVSDNPVLSFTVSENAAYVAHFSQSINNYTITTYADPIAGGTVSGGGTYEQGAICTLTAIPNNGYAFSNWTQAGTIVTLDPILNINVSENATYVAHFSLVTDGYTIAVSANPSTGGIVRGGGTYTAGVTCTVIAIANDGYSFANWTENGTIVSLDDHYSFVVDRERNLIANFDAVSYFVISASAGANGSISPQGDVEVPAGEDQTFTITPDFGSLISKVLVDGVDLGPLETYTFSNVNSNHTISAVFSGWGIEESQTTGVMLFPNPAKDFIIVKGKDIAGIQVFNLQGEKMLDVKGINEENNVSLKNLSSGTYVVLITLQNGKQSYSKIVLSD